MTRYSELYHTERDAHDLTTKSLAFQQYRVDEFFAFIREKKLQDAFCEWLVARNKKVWTERRTSPLPSQDQKTEAQ